MKTRKNFAILAGSLGVAATLIASAATAGDMGQAATCYIETAAADGSLQQQLCRGGVLANAQSGRPLLDRNRQRIGCACPAEGAWDPTLIGVGALAAVGAGVGIAVATSSHGNNPQFPFIPSPSHPSSP
jgi:hypothetical protein